ncbi:hypothetical protein OQA88_8543 [Cercophora sp. LCS_1]
MAARRRLVVTLQVACLVVIALALFSPFYRNSGGFFRPNLSHHFDVSDPEIPPGAVLSRGNVTAYVRSILDPGDTHLPRLECPRPDLSRYNYLKAAPSPYQTRYFFALNLRECLPLLPRLLGSVLEAIRFLGPENCALSIVEGNSFDGTPDVLAALQEQLHSFAPVTSHFVLNEQTDPLSEARFTKLAELRNMALAPMFLQPERYAETTVVFINDVAICLEDILELVHQRSFQGADMACAFDWIGGSPEDGDRPVFYDSYIARGINGDLFFDIPLPSLTWDRAINLFWNDPVTKARFDNHQPFQAFACWNGAVAFTAAPVVNGLVTFRSSRIDKGECHQGEPELFCKDMWYHGYGKIMVVPSINLEYTNEKGKYIKELKGYTSQWIKKDVEQDRIPEWLPPPDKVKCMPTFNDQTWRLWNETLP